MHRWEHSPALIPKSTARPRKPEAALTAGPARRNRRRCEWRSWQFLIRQGREGAERRSGYRRDGVTAPPGSQADPRKQDCLTAESSPQAQPGPSAICAVSAPPRGGAGTFKYRKSPVNSASRSPPRHLRPAPARPAGAFKCQGPRGRVAHLPSHQAPSSRWSRGLSGSDFAASWSKRRPSTARLVRQQPKQSGSRRGVSWFGCAVSASSRRSISPAMRCFCGPATTPLRDVSKPGRSRSSARPSSIALSASSSRPADS